MVETVWLNVPVNEVNDSPDLPDKDNRLIYEHLKFVFVGSREFPLPAIRLKLSEGKFVICEGHKYLAVARDLGIPTVRAVVKIDESDRNTAERIIADGGLTVIPSEELEQELRQPFFKARHVYFFEA